MSSVLVLFCYAFATHSNLRESKMQTRYFLLILLVVYSFSAIAHAKEVLPEVLVTASRIALPENQIGSSVTVISQSELAQRKPVSIADALRLVPGLTVSQQGSLGAFTQVRMRGSEANQVLVLIDGVEANDPATGSEFNFAFLSPASIERIEVIRGPQSSIWGSDALAGVINIITKQGETQREIIATAEIGSNNSFLNTLQISDGTEKTKYFLHGSFFDTDGINTAETGSEKDGHDNVTFRLNASHLFSDNLKVGFNTSYTDASNDFDDATFGAPVDAENKSNVDQFYGRAYIDIFATKNWKHTFSTSLTDTRNKNKDSFGASRTEGEKLKFDYQSNLNFKTDWLFAAEHNFILLLERENERFRQRGPATSFGDPNQTQDSINDSYVTEYRLGINEQLYLSAALRKDDNDNFRDRETYRFTATYSVDDWGTKLRAAYGTAVKNPTFTERFGFFVGSFMGNRNLKPETSEAWEVGVDQTLLNDTTNLGVTLFWEDLKDEIATVFFPVNTAINIDGRSERNGLEFYFDSQISSQLSMRGSYTYLDSTQENNQGKQAREIRVPRNTASININYNFLAKKANLNLEVNYVDEQLDSDFASFPATTVELDDYTLVNIITSYDINGDVQLYARVDNLLDDEYQDVLGFETLGQAMYAGLQIKL